MWFSVVKVIYLIFIYSISNISSNYTVIKKIHFVTYFTKLIGLKVQKASEKAAALRNDHLELPLGPIQATQMATGPF